MGRTAKLLALAGFAAAAFPSGAPAQAGAAPLPYRVLHEFCKGTCIDGSFPQSDQLVLDATGKLYGTTINGARHGFGALYEVFPKHGGAKYFKKVLRPFCAPPRCGAGGAPLSGVIMDTAGNLYGTAQGPGACDTAYEAVLSNGEYTLRVLHSFGSGDDGCNTLVGALAYQGKEYGQLYDGTSPLFGLSYDGGANGRGAIFELIPPKPGR